MERRDAISSAASDPLLPPAQGGTEPAMVYVSDDPRWQYKTVERTSNATLPSQAELDAWGQDGWELTGVVSRGGSVYFYLKRTIG